MQTPGLSFIVRGVLGQHVWDEAAPTYLGAILAAAGKDQHERKTVHDKGN